MYAMHAGSGGARLGRKFYYFGGARIKGFATLRNVPKLLFFWEKIGHAKSVGFWFYSAIWRSESRISSRLQVTSISLIYSLTYSASPGFEPTHL